MRLGSLRHRVTFQRNTEVDDAFGEPVAGWANITDPVWASVKPLAGNERFAAMQVQADVDYMISTRYQSALSHLAPNDRATWNTKIFDIKSVINMGELNREFQVFAKLNLTTILHNVINGSDNVINGTDNVVTA